MNSILEDGYSEYFGFTPQEVYDMTLYYGVPERYDEICKWYDGYRFGNSHIFNPWSVIGYLDGGCIAKPYWVSTSNNDIIGAILENATSEVKEKLYLLLQGESVYTHIDTEVIYPNVKESTESVYSFLVMTGYLKISSIIPIQEGVCAYKVAMTNREISTIYKKEILSKLKSIIPYHSNMAIQEAICQKNVEKLQEELQKLLLQSVSYNDAANESFYHGLVLGFCAMLNNIYDIDSNREAGEGRFDIRLLPRDETLPGVLIEIKACKNASKESLEKLAEKALEQIRVRKYDVDMAEKGTTKIVKYGIAFCGKKVKIVMES